MAAGSSGVSASIFDAIGGTPLLRIEDVYCKCEFLNPSGSVKARIAKYMVEKAEEEGLLERGDTIVEATSGNTGNALSMVAAVKGYRMLVVMPEGLSGERVAISQAFGTEVLHVGHFHVDAALRPRIWVADPATSARRSSSRSGTSRRTASGSARRYSLNSPTTTSLMLW